MVNLCPICDGLDFEVILAASSRNVFSFFSRRPGAYGLLSDQSDEMNYERHDFLSELQNELLYAIIHAIPDPEDRINLALVSKRFFHLVTDNLLEPSASNVFRMTQIRYFMTKEAGLNERDLAKIKALLVDFNISGQSHLLPEMVDFATRFFDENQRREKKTLKHVFCRNIEEIQGIRTTNERFITTENHLHNLILILSIPGLWFFIMLTFMHMLTLGNFMLSASLAALPLVMICYNLHTRIAYVCRTDVLLYTDITSPSALQDDCRETFQMYFPDYEDNGEPLYLAVSRYIQGILYPTLFDKPVRIAPDAGVEPVLEIVIEDNVTRPAI